MCFCLVLKKYLLEEVNLQRKIGSLCNESIQVSATYPRTDTKEAHLMAWSDSAKGTAPVEVMEYIWTVARKGNLAPRLLLHQNGLVWSEQHWSYNEKSPISLTLEFYIKSVTSAARKHRHGCQLYWQVFIMASCTWWTWLSGQTHSLFAKSHHMPGLFRLRGGLASLYILYWPRQDT